MKTKNKKVMAITGVVGPDDQGAAVVQAIGLAMHTPVFVLPADAASYDMMVEQGVKEMTKAFGYYVASFQQYAVCTLKAQGITRPKETTP